jgi:hypothetical protein
VDAALVSLLTADLNHQAAAVPSQLAVDVAACQNPWRAQEDGE